MFGASYLQRQYQDVCRREREAAVRNTSLVRDVAKLKSRLEMAALYAHEARAQRLAVLKVRNHYRSSVPECVISF